MMKHLLLLSVVVACCLADSWEMTANTTFPQKSMEALVFEGLCTDGKHFIMNTKYSIFVMDTHLNVIESDLNAIPTELLKEGYNHLGDCSCDELQNTCYYAVEEPSKVKPSIFVYNITEAGMVFVKEKHEFIQSHMPWVALDTSTRYLYSSEYDDVTQLRVYSADTLEYLHSLQLTGFALPFNGVQGGAFYEGKLYIGINSGDSVYEINITTGEVILAIQQEEKGGDGEYEFEGLTFLDLRDDGRGVMHNTGNHIHPQVIFHADRT